MKQTPPKKDKETAIVKLVDTFKNATGIEFVKEGAKWIVTGAFMGSSDAIPGYSGGTTIALLGFFRKLILVAKSIFIPEPGITRIKALMFFLPFAVGWIVGVFGFAKLTELLASHGFGLELLFFFSPFIIFTIPVFLKSEKPGLTEKKKIVKTYRWLWFALGFLIILSIGLYTLLGTNGFPFSENKKETSAKLNLGEHLMWLKLIGVAYAAGMVSLIPGGSGALVQLLSGMYDKIHWRIMAHAQNNVAGLFIFAFATLAGMLTMVFIMAWGLKKHKQMLAALSLGMLIASVGVIFMIPEHSMWGELNQVKHFIGIPLAMVMGSSSGIILNLYVRRKTMIKARVTT